MSILGSIVQASGGGGGGTSFTDVSTAIDYTVTGTTSERIYVDTTSAVVSITLPAGASDQVIEVIDAGENAGTNIITIVGTIDGVSNATIEADSGSRSFAYSGSAWETSGGFQNYFKRNASTGEISTREPDTFVADELQASSGTATVSEQSVADTDFTSIGANVDQTVADELGNLLVVGVTDQCTGGTAIGTGSDLEQAFDDVIIGINRSSGSIPHTVGYDFGSGNDKVINGYRIHTYGSVYAPTAWTFEGSADNSIWVVLDTQTGMSLADDAWTSNYIFANTASYRYHRINLSAGAADTRLAELEFFEGAYSTTNNTFDTNLATGTAGTFTPSSFLAYDETATLINGAGKINVAYEVDGGGMGALVDQDTFKALGDIAYTTQFDLQLQLVGTQRFSKATLSSAVVKSYVGQSGIVVEQGGLVYAELGDVFKAPQKTTAERDALTPAAGWVIYNSTTNKMNFYSGSAWEAITSA